MEKLRVLLAEDIEILRKGLRALLSAYPDVEIIGESADGIEAVELVEQLGPQVVLMDLSMPRMEGAEAIAEIKRRRPRTRVLALTAYMEGDLVRRTLMAGADGYLLKNVPAEELVMAIRRVAEGRPYVSPEVASLLIESFLDRGGEPGPQNDDGLITGREREVLSLIASGLTCKEIGLRLDLSPKTVDTHKVNIKRKLGARTTAELIVYAIERGLAGGPSSNADKAS